VLKVHNVAGLVAGGEVAQLTPRILVHQPVNKHLNGYARGGP
jgi:hypothetical protein